MPSVRKNKLALGVAWFFLATFFSLNVASAADVPNLSWERGREQSIALGGNTASQLWTIALIGPSGKNLTFSRSSSNSSGFFVYHVFIPLDYPVGTYDVKVESHNESNVVAHVKVELAQSYDPLSDPRAVGGLAVLAFSLLSAFSSSNRAGGAESSDKAEALDSLDAEYHGIQIGRRGWFDKLGLGKSRLIFKLDEYRHIATFELSPRSSFLQRIFADGSYLQAFLGPVGVLTPVVGGVLGYLCGTHTDTAFSVIPMGAGYVIALLVLGLFDAMAGFMGALAYGIYVLAHGDFTTIFQIRGFLGLTALWCGPILAANKMRPLRRENSGDYWWERFGDLIIPPLLVGFSVKGILLALNGFTHHHNLITDHAGRIAIIAGVSIFLRYVVEELAVQATPARLEYLSPPIMPEVEVRYKVVALLVKVLLYLFFMYGFLGWTWQLGLSIVFLIFPATFRLLFRRLPNSPRLFQILPAGIPGIIFMNLVGLLALAWVDSLPIFSADKTQTIFVLAAVPGFIISMVRLFARAPKEGDTRWYMREKNARLYKVSGPIFVAVAALVVYGVLP